MPKQFFITGLPRSRTAWFANLFTWGDSLCYHDALFTEDRGLRFSQSLRMLQNRLSEGVRGHSDASNVFVWKTLQKWFPDAKWVVIDRVLEDALYSTRLIAEEVSAFSMAAMMDSLKVLASETSALVVPFEEINPVKCYKIAEYLGIDIGPGARVRQLCDMNIQIHPPVLKRRLEALKINKLLQTGRLHEIRMG